jgi:Spy/CpxP family protein refolding chaperone
MKFRVIPLATLVILALSAPVWAEPAPPAPAAHDEIGRLFDEMASKLRGLGSHFKEGVGTERRGDRPLITIMLSNRDELGLTPEQVRALESLRSDFQRDAIRREADLRVAEMDLESLLQAEPVEMAKIEAKVREIERFRADLRLARLGVIERGKAQLTSDQRAKLKKLLTEPRPWRPHSRAERSAKAAVFSGQTP